PHATLCVLRPASLAGELCLCLRLSSFFTPPAPTELYTLSLHDALPISSLRGSALLEEGGLVLVLHALGRLLVQPGAGVLGLYEEDRKSTRLNSSHVKISYAVFCLKKKKNKKTLGAGYVPRSGRDRHGER